jgi:hypothetical protein
LKGILVEFFGGGGGRIEVAIWDGAGELDRTAQLPTSTTPQSTSIRGGGGWNGQDMASRLRLYEGIFVDFSAGWGLRLSDFETRWPNAIEPPGPRQQQQTTQQSNNGRKGWGASGQGGLYGRPFGPPLFTMLLLYIC